MTFRTAEEAKVQRLEKVARDAIAQYNKDLEAGGEPVFPDWAMDLLSFLATNDKLVADLRDMLREEFRLADNRDMAVAQAVHDWYLQQFPHMRILIDQPDLAAIIAKVRPPAFSFESLNNGDHRWSDDELAAMQAAPRPAMFINRIETPTTLNAKRYLVLRNLPDHLLGATGVPGIAVPEGPDHGNFVSSDDADRIIDAYIARIEA